MTAKNALSRYMLLIALALIAGCQSKTAEPSTDKPVRAAAEKLRVITYNIHMWEPKVDDLAAVIRAADADIVGLNEAWSEKPDIELAAKLGYNIIYGGQNPPQPVPRKPHWINNHYMPQVLLTRYKIVEHKYFNAKESWKDQGNPDIYPDVPIYRGGTLAVLETPMGNRLAVFVLHLHPWGGGDNEKMTTMRLDEIKGITKQLEPYRDIPTLIIGDHNTRSHHDVTTGVWKTTKYLEANGWTDLFRTVHPDVKTDRGITCGNDGRIDYIFYNQHVKPVDCKVLTNGVFNSKGYDQSDHLGVFGIVEIGG